MRILLSLGNPPGAPTGYGGQGLQLVRWLHAAGHELFVLPWTLTLKAREDSKGHQKGLGSPFAAMASKDILDANKVPHIARFIAPSVRRELLRGPKIWWFRNPLGTFPCAIPKAAVNRLVDTFRVDCLIALQDVFLFDQGPFHCYSIVWMPLHFGPLEHKTALALLDFDRIVCMTRFGQSLLGPVFGGGLRCLDYVPHARDVSPRGPWRPVQEVWPRAPAAQRLEIQQTREAWGWPQDAHVTLLVASNSEASNRKAFEAQIMGWARFAQHYMDRVGRPCFLHIHSNPFGTMNDAGGFDLTRIVEIMGEFPARHELMDPANAAGFAHARMLVHASDEAAAVVPGPDHYRRPRPSSATAASATAASVTTTSTAAASATAASVTTSALTDSAVARDPATRTPVGLRVVRAPRVQFSPAGVPLEDEDIARLYRAANCVLAAACAEGFGVPVLEAQLCGTPVVTNKTTAMTELTVLGVSVPPVQWILRADFNSGWFLPDARGLARALQTVAEWTLDPASLARRRARALRILRARYADNVVAAGWLRVVDVVRDGLADILALHRDEEAAHSRTTMTTTTTTLTTTKTTDFRRRTHQILSVPRARPAIPTSFLGLADVDAKAPLATIPTVRGLAPRKTFHFPRKPSSSPSSGGLRSVEPAELVQVWQETVVARVQGRAPQPPAWFRRRDRADGFVHANTVPPTASPAASPTASPTASTTASTTASPTASPTWDDWDRLERGIRPEPFDTDCDARPDVSPVLMSTAVRMHALAALHIARNEHNKALANALRDLGRVSSLNAFLDHEIQELHRERALLRAVGAFLEASP